MFDLQPIIWTKNHLKTHVRTVHENDKPFTCLICKLSFRQKWTLNQHFKTFHLNDKPFTCLICKQSFGYKGNLKSHVRTVHENDKLVICKQSSDL